MLNAARTTKKPKDGRNLGREKKLWHDEGRHMPLLGCSTCGDRGICGGLSIGRASFDCLDNCCGQPERCDSVCRMKPRDFSRRVREVGGFALDNVPRAERLPEPALPSVAPVLFSGNSREQAFRAPAVCLQLYSIIARHKGKERYASADEIAAAFRFEAGTPLILTGTADDRPLERWWSLGTGRLDAIRRLRELGVALVTTPNYSLFTDRPRWDDMHSMKRISSVHEEFLREGLPAALHVNARTERDWERWTEYIRQRNEVTHLAFEFATGAGWADRIGWHTARLTELAQTAGRPLHLVVRAAAGDTLPRLVSAFADVTVLETSSLIKALRRQRAVENGSGGVRWVTSPTPRHAPVDELLAHNWSVVNRSILRAVGTPAFRHAAE
jgi:hypothetical protein